MAKQRHPPGPPMTLACRHSALINVSRYSAHTEVPWFGREAKCGKCGGKRVDVRPNWKERPTMPTKLRFD